MKRIEIRANGTKRVYHVNTEPSKTDQSFAKDCDVNTIMKKFMKTGQITHIRKHQGQYIDVSEIPDLLTASIQVQQAQDAFDNLPSELRQKFESPQGMYQFLTNPQNDQESIKLGLKKPLPTSDKEDGPTEKSAVKPKAPKTPQPKDSNGEDSKTPHPHHHPHHIK